MTIIELLLTTGIITIWITHWHDKKLKALEIKLQKYLGLIETLAKLAGNETEHDNLRKYLNEALFFSSDNVVGEILRFNKLFTEKSKTANNGNVQMEAKDIQPLIVAIRGDLYLKSKSITREELVFFQKP